jgi:competence protein ComEC
VAALAGRPASRAYALGLAAAVTLAINPYSAGDAGWQLSFAAVLGLLALAPSIRTRLASRRVPAAVAEVAALTGAATIATAPLLAVHFRRVSLASLPANVIVAPVVAPVMWLGMLAGAVAQVDPALAAPLNAVNGPLVGFVDRVAHAAAGVPHSVVDVHLPGLAGAVAGYAVLAVVWPGSRRWASPASWRCCPRPESVRRRGGGRRWSRSWTSARATRR